MPNVGIVASSEVAAGPTYGAEQRVTVGGAPDSVHTGRLEFGTSVQFNAAGRITKIRWFQRFTGGVQNVNLRMWTSGGTLLAGPVAANSSANTYVTTTLPTPVAVTAGQTVVCSMSYNGLGGNVGIPLHSGVLDTWTNTANCTGINVCLVNTTGEGLFPTVSGGSSVYLEPVYEKLL